MSNILVSVIMPSLNSGHYIDEAICSCIEQEELLELIIFDGGSKEETINRIKYWSKKDKRVRFFSQRDKGPADAINKALSFVKGNVIGWLNSDDKYLKNSFKRALNEFKKDENLKILYGQGQHIDSLGRFIEYYPTHKPDVTINKFQDGCFICQPTVFFKKSLITEIGKLDVRLQTCFDFDLWLRVFRKYRPFEIGFVNQVQASTRLHKNTITHRKYWYVNIESAYILDKYLGEVKSHWLEQAARFLIINNRNECVDYLKNSYLDEYLSTKLKKIHSGFIDNFLSIKDNNFSLKIQKRLDLPFSLRLLLNKRKDLQKCGFLNFSEDRNLCIWLLNHGIKEYPFLFFGDYKSNNLLKWLSEINNKKNSRILQAIFYDNDKINKKWFLRKSKLILRIFVYFRWEQITKNSSIRYSSFFYNPNFFKKIHLVLNLSRDQKKVNLIGYPFYLSGIGEDLRTTASALRFKGIKFNILNFQSNFNKRTKYKTFNNIDNEEKGKISIIFLNPEDCYWYLKSKSNDYYKNHYLIGYLPWEFKKWPTQLKDIFSYLDEIWTSSIFTMNSLKDFKKTKKVMPLCVDYSDKRINLLNKNQKLFYRKKYNLPSKNLIFISSFDLESQVERKNPWASIKAFQMAFNPNYPNSPKENDVMLILKTFKPLIFNRDWENLKNIALMDNRIKIIEDDLSHLELMQLYGCCDVLISLHRSEGFGRIIAECIGLGLEIITTNWGGNTDFCNKLYTHLVNYKLIKVLPGTYPSWPNQFWADPDLDEASGFMKEIYNGKRKNTMENIDHLKKCFSYDQCGERYKKRIFEIMRSLS